MRTELGWDESAAAWVQFVNDGDPHRDLLLDNPMLRLCGQVQGRTVLDCGCGEGRFSRMLRKRGATIIGIDPTRDLIAAAKSRDKEGLYLVGSAEDLPLVSDSMDLVISYLVLIDIPDFRTGIKEMARVLRGGGQMIVANLNPFVTAVNPPWVKDSNGKRLHIAVDDYNQERADEVAWRGIEIVNYHRPLSQYMSAFIGSGLVLEVFEEPVPTMEAVRQMPQLLDSRRVPFFHVMRWRKPLA